MPKKKVQKENFQDYIIAQMRAIGATFEYQNPKDLLYDIIIKLWKKPRASYPGLEDIYAAFPKYYEDTIRKYLCEMKHDGLLLNPIRGVWIPIVKKNGNTERQKYYTKPGGPL